MIYFYSVTPKYPLLPARITRLASQRAQPLENLTALPVNKKGARTTQPLESMLRSEFLWSESGVAQLSFRHALGRCVARGTQKAPALSLPPWSSPSLSLRLPLFSLPPSLFLPLSPWNLPLSLSLCFSLFLSLSLSLSLSTRVDLGQGRRRPSIWLPYH